MPHHLRLVVDDELETIELIRGVFTRFGCTVLEALTGSVGLRLAREHDPAIILFDVMLLGFDGFERCRQLCDDPLTTYIPRVVLSARDSLMDRKDAVAAGADRYLVKPLEIKTQIDPVGTLVDQR